jgi:hypothetical protein
VKSLLFPLLLLLSLSLTAQSEWTIVLSTKIPDARMGAWTRGDYTFFGNVENYTNVRQTNFGSLVSATNFTPQFTEVWAPLDGIVFNTGIKIRL